MCDDFRFVTWVGTVVIDGTTYGWADFPTDDEEFDKKLMYFEKYWRIFTLEPGQAPTVALACNNDLVVLDGINDGRGTPGGSAQANGTVVSADGPFADVDPGSRMIWRGKITNFKEDTLDLEFKATLHIYPLKQHQPTLKHTRAGHPVRSRPEQEPTHIGTYGRLIWPLVLPYVGGD